MSLLDSTRLLVAAVALAACSSARPVVYPNEHLQVVGQRQAKEDIDACIARAKDYVESVGAGDVARGRRVGGVDHRHPGHPVAQTRGHAADSRPRRPGDVHHRRHRTRSNRRSEPRTMSSAQR